MSTYRIDPDHRSKSYLDEVRAIESAGLGLPNECVRRKLSWLNQCMDNARKLDGGFVKKIVWDALGGYPEHAWGYTQYSPRPYRQGYGCDGTTDVNIHLIAARLFARRGIDYARVYAEAYSDDTKLSDARAFVRDLLEDEELAAETVVPGRTDRETVRLALADLRQINNHSLAAVLEEQISWPNGKGPEAEQ